MRVSEIYQEVLAFMGQCSEKEALKRISQAVEVLGNKALFDCMLGIVDINTLSDCKTATLPPDVDTVLAVNINGRSTLSRNIWHEFHFNGDGSDRQVTWAWDDNGDVPVFMDIVTPSPLLCIAELPTDLNAVVEVFGYDDKGNPLRRQNPDGSYQDGVYVPANILTDFPNMIPQVNDTRRQIRNFTTVPITTLLAPSNHELTTGALILLGVITTPVPTPLEAGETYYVRSVSDTVIQLHSSASDALADVNPITITSASAASVLTATDRRGFAVATKFSDNNHGIKTGALVTFTAGTMPEGIATDTAYYANRLDANNFTIHTTEAAAQSNTDRIDVASAGVSVVASARQNVYPETTLTFAVNHNFSQGDAVSVQNTSGTPPTPLIVGQIYYVRYLTATSISLHTSLSDAGTGNDPVTLTDVGTGTTALQKTIPASAATGSTNQITATSHQLSAGDLVQFTTTGLFPSPIAQSTVYQAAAPLSANSFTLASTSLSTKATSARERTSNVATITTGAAHGLITGDIVDIEGMGDASYNATQVTITVTSTTAFTYSSAGGNEGSTSDTSGSVIRGRINVTSTGTGQLNLVISRAIALGFSDAWETDATELTTADPVKMASTGSLPTTTQVTLDTTTTYYVRKIDDDTVKLYTTSGFAADTTVRATASRARTTNVATIVTAAAHGLNTNDYVDITGVGGTGYNATSVQITKIDGTTFTYPNVGGDESTAVDTGGAVSIAAIRVLGLGINQTSLVLERTVTVDILENPVTVSSAEYLQDNAVVNVTTNGTLPTPLATATDYKIKLTDGKVEFYTMSDILVTLTDIGAGLHNFEITSNFSVALPTSYVVVSNNYTNGDAVTLESATPPSPLVNNTVYYVRRIGDDNVELYSTQGQAIAEPSTTGRIVATNAGTGTHTLVSTEDAYLVKDITRVIKPLTNGRIELYVWDSGRGNMLTQIGNYQPQETNPSYRRIKIAHENPCLRVRFRRKTWEIRSQNDWLPFRNSMSVLCMVKALEFLRKNFYDQYRAYSDEATKLLLEEQDVRKGPDVIKIQINDYGFTEPGDKDMDTGRSEWGY